MLLVRSIQSYRRDTWDTWDTARHIALPGDTLHCASQWYATLSIAGRHWDSSSRLATRDTLHCARRRCWRVQGKGGTAGVTVGGQRAWKKWVHGGGGNGREGHVWGRRDVRKGGHAAWKGVGLHSKGGKGGQGTFEGAGTGKEADTGLGKGELGGHV